jgi:hypothetical protein
MSSAKDTMNQRALFQVHAKVAAIGGKPADIASPKPSPIISGGKKSC